MISSAQPPIHLTPATNDRKIASDWLRRFEGAGLDGVIAKQTSGTYETNKRVMLKVTHERDCDAVVRGFRWHKRGDRFRHTAQFRRWRFDKKPADCTYAQLEVVPPQELAEIFPHGR